MKCQDMEERLSAYADGQARGAEGQAVLRHMEGCADCRLRLRVLMGMKRALAKLTAPPMPEELRAALLEEASRGPEAPAVPWLGRAGARYGMIGAAFAAAALMVMQLAAGRGDEVPVDLLLAAHREYALTMPLSQQELLFSRRAEGLDPEGGVNEL